MADTTPTVQLPPIQQQLAPPSNPPVIADTTTTTTVVETSVSTLKLPHLEPPHLQKSYSSPALTTLSSNDNSAATTTTTITTRTKIRRMQFRPRMSPLDYANLESSKESFRGFFTLFWIAMGFYVILTMIRNVELEGTLLSLSLFSLFSKDAVALMISDFFMVGLTLGAVVYAKLLVWGWFRYYYFGMVLQHSLQALFLGMNIYWTFFRDWPWVQSGFFVLHTIVMMMKMHSYTSLCGDLSVKYHRLTYLKRELPRWIAEHKHETYSEREKAELDNMEEEIKEHEEELVQGQHRFPEIVTFVNYFDYLLVPSLVYQLEYPRTDRIRPWYIFEKSVATLGTFLLLYLTTERYILPTVFKPDMASWRVIIELLFPFMINYLLIFYIIFECICNAFAEVSRFADRSFYDDWWNSVTYDEFARKWNKPVHHFLLRHVYASSIETYNLSKPNATFLTFFLSSCFHELVLIIVTRKIRMYLFVFQMLQLPLIWIGRLKFIQARPWLGNVIFWVGMFCGPPLLGVLYCREVFWDAVDGEV